MVASQRCLNIPLKQHTSSFRGHQHHLESWIEHRLLEPLKVSDSVGPGGTWALAFLVSFQMMQIPLVQDHTVRTTTLKSGWLVRFWGRGEGCQEVRVVKSPWRGDSKGHGCQGRLHPLTTRLLARPTTLPGALIVHRLSASRKCWASGAYTSTVCVCNPLIPGGVCSEIQHDR